MTTLRILCSKPGRWRGGIKHTADRTWYEGELTPEQVAAIENDPVFTVVPVAQDAVPNTQGGADGAGGSVADAAGAEPPGTAGDDPDGPADQRAAGSSGSADDGGETAPSEAGKGEGAAAAAASKPATTTIVTDTARAPRIRRKKA